MIYSLCILLQKNISKKIIIFIFSGETMECENSLLLAKFRCNLDLDNRYCRDILWPECRTFQDVVVSKKKEK